MNKIHMVSPAHHAPSESSPTTAHHTYLSSIHSVVQSPARIESTRHLWSWIRSAQLGPKSSSACKNYATETSTVRCCFRYMIGTKSSPPLLLNITLTLKLESYKKILILTRTPTPILVESTWRWVNLRQACATW